MAAVALAERRERIMRTESRLQVARAAVARLGSNERIQLVAAGLTLMGMFAATGAVESF